MSLLEHIILIGHQISLVFVTAFLAVAGSNCGPSGGGGRVVNGLNHGLATRHGHLQLDALDHCSVVFGNSGLRGFRLVKRHKSATLESKQKF